MYTAVYTPKFSVLSILGLTWRTIRKNPLVFVGIALASEIVSRLLMAVTVFLFLGENSSEALSEVLLSPGTLNAASLTVWGKVACHVVRFAVIMLFQGMITCTVFQLFVGEEVSIRESLSRSLSRLLDLFLASVAEIAAGLCVVLGAWLLLVLFLLGLGLFAGELSGMGKLLGTLVLIVPLIIFLSLFFTTWFVSAPACVIERLGALASLARSGALTKGYRLKIANLMLDFWLIGRTLGLIADALPLTEAADFIVGNLIDFALLTFAGVVPAVAYYTLRVVKENLTHESLADLFSI